MANQGFVNIDAWVPDQVADWLKGLDDALDPYISHFLNNDIDGKRLLCLTHRDLANLKVIKLGHQEMILEAIDLLSTLHYELESENLQALSLHLSCRASSLLSVLNAWMQNTNNEYRMQAYDTFTTDDGLFPLNILSSVSEVINLVKPLISWLDRSPFSTSGEYIKKRNILVHLGMELVSAVQSDNTSQSRDKISETCEKMMTTCNSIVRESKDPLTIQPCALELATIRKCPEEDLGLHIQSSYNGTHIIGEIKDQYPADQCGKIEFGDEVIQVNYQTVIGWQLRKLVDALKENPKEVILTLKKRPRHVVLHDRKGHRRKNSNKRNSRRKIDRNSRHNELLTVLPPPSEPFSEMNSSSGYRQFLDYGYCVPENDSDTEGEVFQGKPEVIDYNLDPKHRRATVSGGSPTLKRPIIKITTFQGRPKSTSFNAQSSEESPSTGSTTPEGIVSPEEDMRAKVEEWKGELRHIGRGDSFQVSTELLHQEAGASPRLYKTESGYSPRRGVDDRPGHEIAGDAVTDSPKLVRITRLDSSPHGDTPTSGSPTTSETSDENASNSSGSGTLPRASSMTSYAVNIVGGMVQRVPVYSKQQSRETSQSPSSILRSSKRTIRKVGTLRRISCKDLGHGDCQGWLWRKRESSGVLASKWTKRWCILKQSNMYLYKDQEDNKAQGVIYLPGFKVSPAPEIKSKKYAFKAHHSGTTFYFAADRQDDMSKWMNKMGLAAIVFDTSQLPTTAGFISPASSELSLIESETYYSESDEEDDDSSDQGSTRTDDNLSMVAEAPNHNPEDCNELGQYDQFASIYRKIRKAELGLDGSDKKRSRHSMLTSAETRNLRNSSDIDTSMKLSSLSRTLKAKEKDLAILEEFLANDSVTSSLLNDFKEHHLAILSGTEEGDHSSSNTPSEAEDSTEVESVGSTDEC